MLWFPITKLARSTTRVSYFLNILLSNSYRAHPCICWHENLLHLRWATNYVEYVIYCSMHNKHVVSSYIMTKYFFNSNNIYRWYVNQGTWYIMIVLVKKYSNVYFWVWGGGENWGLVILCVIFPYGVEVTSQ